jgi:hypothetical protein
VRRLAALSLLVALAAVAADRAPRSPAAKAAFQRENPCPSTGQRRGACPGYVIDHVDPLCNGGADDSSNMQWQTVEAAKVKDHAERQLCRFKHHTDYLRD